MISRNVVADTGSDGSGDLARAGFGIVAHYDALAELADNVLVGNTKRLAALSDSRFAIDSTAPAHSGCPGAAPTGRADKQRLRAELLLGEARALDARGDLRERDVARRRGVVAEGREAAVVASCRAARRDVLRRLEDAVAHLLRRLDARVDRVDDADEDPLARRQVLADDARARARGPASPASAT